MNGGLRGEVGGRQGPQLRHSTKLDYIGRPTGMNTGIIMSEGWAGSNSQKSGSGDLPTLTPTGRRTRTAAILGDELAGTTCRPARVHQE